MYSGQGRPANPTEAAFGEVNGYVFTRVKGHVLTGLGKRRSMPGAHCCHVCMRGGRKEFVDPKTCGVKHNADTTW